MPSPGTTKDRARTSPAKAQTQKLLRTMCNFMLPLIQRAGGGGHKTTKAKRMQFGVEAEEFVLELEKFISRMVSRSQAHSKDIVVETTGTLGKDSFNYLEGTSWLWGSDELVPEEKVIMHGNSDDDRNLNYVSVDDGDTDSFASDGQNSDEEVRMQAGLQRLREHITQKMPIRLLCFEPHNSNLKISLLERADIYNYLVPKFRAKPESVRIHDWIEDLAEYAILSHTWTQDPGELTYGDWWRGSALKDKGPKCQKLINFCQAAWEDYGITLGWIDTVCINKESSAELDESIRSMFAWYENAAICITYLEETDRLSDMRNDRWFTRGWTLQELVAPRRIKFYNKNWLQLSKRTAEQGDQVNDKDNDFILEEIRHATTITRYELESMHWVSLSRKMQLAAKRQVTREEDSAYCLMGIFNVSILTAYGEGAGRAFFRLVEEILRSTNDVSEIFNWAGTSHPSSFKAITSLFPSSPSNYLNCLTDESGPHSWRSWRLIEPLALTHLGLRTPFLLMPAVPNHVPVSDFQPMGDYHASIAVSPIALIFPQNYGLLDKRAFGPSRFIDIPWGGQRSLTFGTLNVEAEGSSIRIPKTCLAVLLARNWDDSDRLAVFTDHYTKVETEKPIVFTLENTGEITGKDGDETYYQIERSELVKHGMELVTLYL